MPAMDAAALVDRMDRATAAWHAEPATEPTDLVLMLHRANFELWHLEDSARDPMATAEQIAATKRSIDRVNQRRNDYVECIDAALLDSVAAQHLPAADAPLHSETPGQVLDRLSILSLKRFHTAEEAARATATEAHRSRNRERLETLHMQSADLAGCLLALWQDVLAGRRRFKLYRQFKMYNDADLNPVVYGARVGKPSADRG